MNKKLILIIVLTIAIKGYTQISLKYDDLVINDKYFTTFVEQVQFKAYQQDYNGVIDMPHLRVFGVHAMSPYVLFTANSNVEKINIVFYLKFDIDKEIIISKGDRFILTFENDETIDTFNVAPTNRKGIVHIDVTSVEIARYLAIHHLKELAIFVSERKEENNIFVFPVKKEYNDQFTPSIGMVSSLFTDKE